MTHVVRTSGYRLDAHGLCRGVPNVPVRTLRLRKHAIAALATLLASTQHLAGGGIIDQDTLLVPGLGALASLHATEDERYGVGSVGL